MPHPATLPQPAAPFPERRPRPAPRRRPVWEPRPLPDAPAVEPQRRPARLSPATAVSAEVAHDGNGGEFGVSRGRVLRWMEFHTGAPAPFPAPPAVPGPAANPAANPGATAEPCRFPGHRSVGCAEEWTTGDGRCFGAALDGRGAAPGARGWRVQVFLVETGGITRLHATLLTGGGLGARSVDRAGAPDLVHDLADSPGLTDYGWRLRAQPWIVRDHESVEELILLLGDPERTRPVFVTGLAVHETDAETAAIDVADLAWRTVGLAHVVVLTGPMTFALSERLGRRFSVFGNAVRTYRPGCVLDREEAEHPMALADTVKDWRGGSREFVNFLAREAAHTSLARQAPEIGAVPTALGRGFLREPPEAAGTGRVPEDAYGRALEERTPDGDGLHPLGAGVDETDAAGAGLGDADPDPDRAAEPELPEVAARAAS